MKANPKEHEPNFDDLIAEENQAIASEREGDARTDTDDTVISARRTLGASRRNPVEKWVTFPQGDRTGLAFSGGGIRSATFNLGLLQGLNDLGLLPLFDYLSTVSGGGYVGAWWTAWKARGDRADKHFPRIETGDEVAAEPAEVRHLRRFSNFLVPRFGLFELEFWNGVVAVLSGFI